jgi:MFS family permease
MTTSDNPAEHANNMRLFWASFLTLIAAGVGFAVRGDILNVWGSQFGFTQAELGGITGFGLVGFGVTIIAFSFVADRIGYGPLMVLAFLLHLSSGIVMLLAAPAFGMYGKNGAYWCLSISGILMSLANGTCEAVINPLTATLFPKEKTHWLNILHAGWPGGLVLGAMLGLLFKTIGNVPWEVQMGMFLLPTLAYGLLMVGRRFPTSEAAAAGVGLKTMLLEIVAPVLLVLFLLHAMVGYVELGVDSWIQNISGNIMSSPDAANWLFIWTSGLMFALRFFAGPIVHKISPLGLLFACAILASCGLLLFGLGPRAVWYCFLAGTVYGIGKTFFWPTMLGVVSERYPRGGALTLGMIGGIGMFSAGLLGAPGIGYNQVYLEKVKLVATDPPAYERYKSPDPTSFLIFPPVAGLDGSKVAVLKSDGKKLDDQVAGLTKAGKSLADDPNLNSLVTWWQSAKQYEAQDKAPVEEAQLFGGRQALVWTAAVPATMAVGYLLLILYFRMQGGYQQVHIGGKEEEEAPGLEGRAAPVEY